MLIRSKSTYQPWEKTLLFNIVLVYLVSDSVCSLPIKPPLISDVNHIVEVSDPRNITKEFVDERQNLRKKIKHHVLSANLKSIVEREYAKYFNNSWLNSDNEDNLQHECLLGPSQYYLWWLDANGSVRPGLNSKNVIALDLSNKGLSERNLSRYSSPDKTHVC